jgi:hypothetical protein
MTKAVLLLFFAMLVGMAIAAPTQNGRLTSIASHEPSTLTPPSPKGEGEIQVAPQSPPPDDPPSQLPWPPEWPPSAIDEIQ